MILIVVVVLSVLGHHRVKRVVKKKQEKAISHLHQRSTSSYGSKSTLTSDLTDRRNADSSGRSGGVPGCCEVVDKIEDILYISDPS